MRKKKEANIFVLGCELENRLQKHSQSKIKIENNQTKKKTYGKETLSLLGCSLKVMRWVLFREMIEDENKQK